MSKTGEEVLSKLNRNITMHNLKKDLPQRLYDLSFDNCLNIIEGNKLLFHVDDLKAMFEDVTDEVIDVLNKRKNKKRYASKTS